MERRKLIDNEYTNEELNNEYFKRPIVMSDNIRLCTVNRTPYRSRHVSIYELDM